MKNKNKVEQNQTKNSFFSTSNKKIIRQKSKIKTYNSKVIR